MALLNARNARKAALMQDGYAGRYRRQAAMCRERSDSAADPSARSIFLRLAALYQGMADQFAVAADAHKADGRPGSLA
jgi:hypothetical protein